MLFPCLLAFITRDRMGSTPMKRRYNSKTYHEGMPLIFSREETHKSTSNERKELTYAFSRPQD